MKRDHDDSWRPYESWAAGNVDEGEWVIHECGVGGVRASSDIGAAFFEALEKMTSKPSDLDSNDSDRIPGEEEVDEDVGEDFFDETLSATESWSVSSIEELEDVASSLQGELQVLLWEAWVESAEWRLFPIANNSGPPNVFLEDDFWE